eukprot:6207256-Pleurochrysis_carterae.AAC.1
MQPPLRKDRLLDKQLVPSGSIHKQRSAAIGTRTCAKLENALPCPEIPTHLLHLARQHEAATPD